MTNADGTAAERTSPHEVGALERFWRMQDQWSRLADRKKRRVVRGRAIALVLVVVAAALGALSATLADVSHTLSAWSKGCAAAAAGCAAVLPLLRPLYTGKALAEFTVARRISENVKSLVVSWLALNGGASSTAGTRELNRQVMALRLLAPELIAELDDEAPLSQPLPPISDVDSYLALRVREQIDTYYRPRARRIDRTLDRFDRWTFGLGLLGAFLGAATVTLGGRVAGWIAVVTTVVTALSVHTAASQYRFQQLEFTRTAEQLEQLVAAATDAPALEATEVVADGEAIILGENRAWQTALSKPEAGESESSR